jgi:hypothetical protein
LGSEDREDGKKNGRRSEDGVSGRYGWERRIDWDEEE